MDVQLILSAEMWFENDYGNDDMSSLWFKHAGMNIIISMATALTNGCMYDDSSSFERTSLKDNSNLSAVTRPRYDYRSDKMCLIDLAGILCASYLLCGARLHICI